MMGRIWVLLATLLSATSAQAEVCHWPVKGGIHFLPQAVGQAVHVRDLQDAAFLHEPGTPDSAPYIQMREWIESRVNPDPMELIRRHRAVLATAPSRRQDLPLIDAILSGAVGVIGDISCLEALLINEHTARVPLSLKGNEFIALVLARTGQLRIYFISGDIVGSGPSLASVESAIQSDLAQGWQAFFHLHNHPFSFDNRYRDIAGTTIPSSTDANSYRKMRNLLGLREARITNGISTIRIEARQFDEL